MLATYWHWFWVGGLRAGVAVRLLPQDRHMSDMQRRSPVCTALPVALCHLWLAHGNLSLTVRNCVPLTIAVPVALRRLPGRGAGLGARCLPGRCSAEGENCC